MKIGFWVSNIATAGGVQRVTSVIANSLSKKHDIYIISHDTDEELKNNYYPLDKKVTVINMPKKMNFHSYPSIFNHCLRKLNKITGIFNKERLYKILRQICLPTKKATQAAIFFNQYNFDIVVGVEGDKALMLSEIAKYGNFKSIGWQHNSFDAYFNTKGKYFWNMDILYKNNIKNLDKYIVLNEYDSERINKEFKINSSYIYNPRSFVSEDKCDMKKKQFISCGRFVYAKGFDILIEAINKFVKKNDEWKFIIVGDGKEKNKIERKIKEYNLHDVVQLPGYTNDVKKFYLDSSVYVLSSRWEGMPMVILEALEMGLSVVSNNITAIKPLVDDGVEGYIVDIDETGEKLCEKLLKIADSYETRKKMSKAAIKKSKIFEVDPITKEWISLLEETYKGEKHGKK